MHNKSKANMVNLTKLQKNELQDFTTEDFADRIQTSYIGHLNISDFKEEGA